MLRYWGIVLLTIIACAGCVVEDVEPASEGTTREPLRAALFADGFESGTLSTRWQSGGLTAPSIEAAFEGSWGAKIYATSSLTVTIDTRGQEDVTVEYARRAIDLTGQERLIVEWSSNGTTWQNLESTQDGAFRKQFFALGDGASGQAALRLRFRTTAAFPWTGADIDSVSVNGEPVTPASQQTTLVLVRNDDTRNPVLNYVRGGTHFSKGTYTWKPQPLPFVQLTNSNKVIQAPSSVLDAAGSQIVVARARRDGTLTRIEVVRAGYPAMLGEATVQQATSRSLFPSSPVTVAHLGNDLVILWAEGSTLLMVRSTDRGASWGSVETLSAPSVGGQFAIGERSNGELVVARTITGGAAIRIEAGVIRTNKTYTVLGDVVNISNATPVVSLSVAENDGDLFVAHAISSMVRITRWTDYVQSTAVTNAPVVGSGIRSASIHPSPFGWAMQWVYSYSTSQGERFATRGRRSDDGLAYITTTTSFADADTGDPGRTDMSLTPVPMPWIVKTHDSGANEDAVSNVFIVGEGFTYADRGQFLRAAEILTLNIESRTPYRFNKERYNVWAIADYSKQRFYDDTADWGLRDTLFDSVRTQGFIVVPGHRAVDYFNRVLHSYNLSGSFPQTRSSGFIIMNTTPQKEIAITPNDPGVPVSPFRVNDLTVIHEYQHTGSSGFGLGDHDIHNQGPDPNRSFDGRFAQNTSPPHDWQGWFTFGGLAPSRKLEVTPAFRANPGTVPPFSSDPASPSFVSARDFFNVGLWESVDSFGWDFNQPTRQYQPVLSCAMNSRNFQNEVLCPVCGEVVVGSLMDDQNQTYDRASYRAATGAFLEFYVRPPSSCGNGDGTADLNLTGLVSVNGTVVPASAFERNELYGSRIGVNKVMTRVDIGPFVSIGVRATVTFRTRPSSDLERRVFVPGLQIVNGRGARYSMEPSTSATATALSRKTFDASCAYMYWDLATGADGQLAVSFVPN